MAFHSFGGSFIWYSPKETSANYSAHDIYYNKSDVDIEFSRTKLFNQLRDFKRKLELVQSDDLDDSFDSFFD